MLIQYQPTKDTKMKLHEIAEQKALKVAEMRSLLSADKLNAEGQAKFDTLKTQVTDLEGQEARARFLDDAERRSMGGTNDKPLANLESRISLVDAIATLKSSNANLMAHWPNTPQNMSAAPARKRKA
jgi:hypothetical protein